MKSLGPCCLGVVAARWNMRRTVLVGIAWCLVFLQYPLMIGPTISRGTSTQDWSTCTYLYWCLLRSITSHLLSACEVLHLQCEMRSEMEDTWNMKNPFHKLNVSSFLHHLPRFKDAAPAAKKASPPTPFKSTTAIHSCQHCKGFETLDLQMSRRSFAKDLCTCCTELAELDHRAQNRRKT